MAVLDPSDSSIGRGCFRARSSDDQEDPCLLSERGKKWPKLLKRNQPSS